MTDATIVGLPLTIERTYASPEYGTTSFTIELGNVMWHLELEDLARLFPQSADLTQLLLMPLSEKRCLWLVAALSGAKDSASAVKSTRALPATCSRCFHQGPVDTSEHVYFAQGKLALRCRQCGHVLAETEERRG